jgi:hypothetical protein
MKVYLTNYSDNKRKMPIIKGRLENEIRRGYVGGIVDVVENIVTNSYKYDANSHYPAAMKNPMPVGNPVYSNIKDLDKIFGFVNALVVAPTKEELRVPVLPVKDNFGNIICPRGTFE